jgi:hypothetical protein
MSDWPGPDLPHDEYRRALHDAAIAVTFASLGIDLLRTQLAGSTESREDRALVVADLRATVERLHDEVRVIHRLTCGASNGHRLTVIK